MEPDPLDLEAFRRHGHALVDWVADYLAGLDYRPVREAVEPGDVRAKLPEQAPEQAEPFARAFVHYWAGHHDEAIHIALPRIEAVLRKMLVASGGIAYVEPSAGRAGRDKTLGMILNELHNVLPGSGWHRSFVMILTEPTGLNLRNKYLHGQITQPLREHAALVLHLAAYLRLLQAVPSAGE